MTDQVLAKKARAHQTYRLRDGTIVPGVTTVLGVLGKPALIAWANKMGLQGIDTNKYTDAAAVVGTACHALIQSHITGVEFDPSPYDAETLDLAENGYLKYLEWEGQHRLEHSHSEMQMVSEKYRFGGTVDLWCKLDGVPTLIDFKTGASGIYDEMLQQVCAYQILLEENSFPTRQIMIIRVGKSDKMDYETRLVGNWEIHKRIFLDCLDIYYAQKELRGVK